MTRHDDEMDGGPRAAGPHGGTVSDGGGGVRVRDLRAVAGVGVWVKDLTGSDGLAALCMLAMWLPTWRARCSARSPTATGAGCWSR